MAAAKARGRKGGRPSKLSDKQLAEIRRMNAAAERTVTELAHLFGVTRPTIYRALEPSPVAESV